MKASSTRFTLRIHCADIALACPGYELLREDLHHTYIALACHSYKFPRVPVEVLTPGHHSAHPLYSDPASTFMTMPHTAMDDQPFFWAVHQEYIQELHHSDNPLLHILANIEEANETLCSIGVGLEDERTFSLSMLTALEDYHAECLAAATMEILEHTANIRLPNLIRYLHTACHALAYAQAQAQSFPTAVALQDVLRNTNVDFRIFVPPADLPIPRSRNEGAAFSACAPWAHEAAPSPEEAQGATMASEYLQALRRSNHPLSQLLATIEESDLVLCAAG